MSSNTQKPDDGMRLLRQRYFQRLREQQNELSKLLNLCEGQALSDADRQSLRAQAHKLAGTGRTYGFQEISQNGKALEEALLANPQLESSQVAPLLSRLISACMDAAKESLSDAHESPPEQTARAIPQQKMRDLPVILTVDDDDNVTSLISEMFRNEAQIFCAANADDGARLMRERRPDLVLLDDMMPGSVTGLRMLEVIRDNPELAKIPVIMLTTSDRPQDVMRGYVAGAIDYVTKPFEPAQLSKKVADHLSKQNATILVADDDSNVTDLLTYKLEAIGYKVVQCENGMRALLAMENFTPAMAILDRMMPGMDGLALLQKMRQNPALKDVPVLFLTARRQEADVVEGLRLGASDYIPKPFNPDEVVVRMERFLKTRQRA